MQVCGGPGLDCSGCGGALCSLFLGGRKCGGPSCDGVVSASKKALETAKKAKNLLATLPLRLQESEDKASYWFCPTHAVHSTFQTGLHLYFCVTPLIAMAKDTF